MMMVVMMVMVVATGRPLRLRRNRSREAENKYECNQKLLHAAIDENAQMRDYPRGRAGISCTVLRPGLLS
jgi:hypothetical protein